jgi:hypothetical protein
MRDAEPMTAAPEREAEDDHDFERFFGYKRTARRTT